ncbi:hypothetical protein [Bacillus velezensis]|uniref:hypothetical protein n=1 Tax=Bacillus velezensis TaxID=492670 RepID=UPI0023DEF197|nr:hypothetical protein [Bacillus velezensis]MDF3254979.1 hypothetical protein [Bacillus velezensis]MDF3267792.1 hypothetical protein [Bacillus velezensis]
MKMTFNRNPITFGKTVEQPSQELIKNTPALHNASLEDALKFGGELTRQAIGTMDLTFSKKHIIVDTKVHMLMPAFSPALSGWHSDGVPRGAELNPTVRKAPNIQAQENMDASIFHLFVTGQGCLTQFLDQSNIELEVPDTPDSKLYSMLNQQVTQGLAEGKYTATDIPSCTAVKWDWWDLHTAQPAKEHEWRFLIRVTETDLHEPKTDLRDIIRTQQQVYLPHNFGW